ncbi:RluA family pseudouridine synthase [Marinicella rhabdoformis]|uniref:RluA family pseudouridine synthase n=1 Tax=Marinicella rhabdoformis TaxID=2580566 RepID=UPI0012AEB549|nr:RluA family pseudouridine synthase [Marinicella rhabdoformis]
MDKKPIFQVSDNDLGMRLDNFILKQRRHITKSVLYKLIRKGQVRVNGKRCKPELKLDVNDTVRVPPFIFFDEKEKVQVPDASRARMTQAIVFEDADYVVLNKPAGIPCHVGTGHDFGVIEIIQSMPEYTETQLAHRLDVHTSGCLLLAKNRQALLAFQAAMKDHQVEKQYLAKLEGKLSSEKTVDLPLNTDNRINGIRTVVPDTHGKSAETTFKPIKFDEHHTWVVCQIKHGRTHQIRAHAASMNMSVVGDTLYGARASKGKRKIYLHAQSLSFGDYDWRCEAGF